MSTHAQQSAHWSYYGIMLDDRTERLIICRSDGQNSQFKDISMILGCHITSNSQEKALSIWNDLTTKMAHVQPDLRATYQSSSGGAQEAREGNDL